MAVVLKDVARLTGYSITTVSRVLRGDATLRVTEETREKIWKVALQLGYRNSGQSRDAGTADRQGTVRRIGIAQMRESRDLREDVYYLALKDTLEEACFYRQWSTVPMLRDVKGAFVKNDDRLLDGIFAIGHFTETEVGSFQKYTPNLVFLDSDPVPGRFYSILPNYRLAVQQALDCLAAAGYREIAYAGAVQTFGHYRELQPDPRFTAFRDILQERACYDPDLVLDCQRTAEGGYAAMAECLQRRGSIPAAIFVASDVTVPGMLRFFQEHRISVPGDVSLITFNNTVLSEFASPPLTSIDPLMRESSRAAVVCMSLLWEENSRGKTIVVPCDLMERESVRQRPEQPGQQKQRQPEQPEQQKQPERQKAEKLAD